MASKTVKKSSNDANKGTTPFEAPKVKSGRSALPSYLTTAKVDSKSFLSNTDLLLANLDITSLRNQGNTATVVKALAKASPDLSSAIFSSVRIAISGGYKVVARNLDKTLNVPATKLAQVLCSTFDCLNAVKGFNDYPALRDAAESMGRELLMFGACGIELVLNASRLPEGLAPVSTEPSKLKFKSDGKRKIPYQIVGGVETSLDVPTFFYTSLDQDLSSSYADSPVQAAIQPIIASQEFANDLRRVFHRGVHPRPTITIDTDKWRQSLPPDVANDATQAASAMASTISELKSQIDGLAPEDALVLFDVLTADVLNNGSISLSDEYKVFSSILNGKLSAGAKSMPVVLGHEAAGSTNIASTQSMLFVKNTEGAVQFKLNGIFSRLFTLALRLFGLDVYAEFSFDRIDLRPDSELEAYKAMKQSRVLELLSVGYYSNEEASLDLTGTLPEPNAPNLSGTMFYKPSANNVVATPESNTSALNQTLSPATPKEPKS